MKVNLPKLENLADVRKYLMVIESLELNKLNNVISYGSIHHQNHHEIKDIKTMKNYYGDLTQFLLKKQNDSRMDEFETAFVKQTEEFVQFWQNLMSNFKMMSEGEMQKLIEKNDTLKTELSELLQKTMGFQPPPNSLFLNLQFIRKVANKLKTNESIQFLQLDFYKKHNDQINEKWIHDRKQLILTKLDHFENRLEASKALISEKLNLELEKLHVKRLKQFDKLMVKYGKVKNFVIKTNTKEMQELTKLKDYFILKHKVPMYYHQNEFLLTGVQQKCKFPKNDTEDILDPMMNIDPDLGGNNGKKGGKYGRDSKGRSSSNPRKGSEDKDERKSSNVNANKRDIKAGADNKLGKTEKVGKTSKLDKTEKLDSANEIHANDNKANNEPGKDSEEIRKSKEKKAIKEKLIANKESK